MPPSHILRCSPQLSSPKRLACNSYFLQALVRRPRGSLISHLACRFQRNYNQKALKEAARLIHCPSITTIAHVVCVDVDSLPAACIWTSLIPISNPISLPSTTRVPDLPSSKRYLSQGFTRNLGSIIHLAAGSRLPTPTTSYAARFRRFSRCSIILR